MEKEKKKEHSSEAFKFATRFLSKQLQHSLFNNSFLKTGKLEQEFPLCFIYENRKGDRKQIWKEIHLYKNAATIKDCKAALIAFSKLLIPYVMLPRKDLAYIEEKFLYKPSIKFMPLKSSSNKVVPHQGNDNKQSRDVIEQEIKILKDILNIKIYFPETRYWIEKEIKWRERELTELKDKSKVFHDIDGITFLYDSFKRCCKVELENIHPMTVAKVLNIIQPEFAKVMEFQHSPGQPPYLPFNAMVFAVFMSISLASHNKRKSATLTANLINEYCYHNSLIQNICPEINQKYVLNQWDNSKYKGEYLRQALPHFFKSF